MATEKTQSDGEEPVRCLGVKCAACLWRTYWTTGPPPSAQSMSFPLDCRSICWRLETLKTFNSSWKAKSRPTVLYDSCLFWFFMPFEIIFVIKSSLEVESIIIMTLNVGVLDTLPWCFLYFVSHLYILYKQYIPYKQWVGFQDMV